MACRYLLIGLLCQVMVNNSIQKVVGVSKADNVPDVPQADIISQVTGVPRVAAKRSACLSLNNPERVEYVQ